MTDDEFRTQVLAQLDRITSRLDGQDMAIERSNAAISHLGDRMFSRLDAIVSRLDEQDMAIDRLTNKVDRLATMSAAAMGAGEQALTQLTALSRRVSRLEKPGD